MPANSRAFFKMNLFFVSLIFAGMGVLHIPPLPQFFLPGTRGMSLGVKGLPVYEEGEEPKTEIKEKYGEREMESGVTLGGER